MPVGAVSSYQVMSGHEFSGQGSPGQSKQMPTEWTQSDLPDIQKHADLILL